MVQLQGSQCTCDSGNQWLNSKKTSQEATALWHPHLVLHVEVRLHMLIVELDRCHGAVFMVVLLLVAELPAEGLWRVAQASTHYSEYLPREANSHELAETCRSASPTTAVPLLSGFLQSRTNRRNGILVSAVEEHGQTYTHQLFSSGNLSVSTSQNPRPERPQENQTRHSHTLHSQGNHHARQKLKAEQSSAGLYEARCSPTQKPVHCPVSS